MLLISPNSDVKSIILSNFGQGPFPKIAGKSPAVNMVKEIQIDFAKGHINAM